MHGFIPYFLPDSLDFGSRKIEKNSSTITCIRFNRFHYSEWYHLIKVLSSLVRTTLPNLLPNLIRDKAIVSVPSAERAPSVKREKNQTGRNCTYLPLYPASSWSIFFLASYLLDKLRSLGGGEKFLLRSNLFPARCSYL